MADGATGLDSNGGGGRIAAQTTINSLVNDYHATPPGWDTTVALDRLIHAQNTWLADHKRRFGNRASALTTLSALLLRGHRYTVAHVGDNRVYLLRGDDADDDDDGTQLRQGHALDQRDFARLTRAIGLDDGVRVDSEQRELRVGDRLLLTSDGVHDKLRAERLGALPRKQVAALAPRP